MRPRFLASLWAIAVLAVFAFAGCQNPIDPIDKSDKIQGLSSIDFSATLGAWNSDPGNDGLLIDMDYYNEFGDGLSFHDKSHDVIIELWTQVPDSTPKLRDQLFFSRTVRYENSDDTIRIPIEAYYEPMKSHFDGTVYEGFVVVRVHPDIAGILLDEERPATEELEGRIGKRIAVESRDHIHIEQFEIYS